MSLCPSWCPIVGWPARCHHSIHILSMEGGIPCRDTPRLVLDFQIQIFQFQISNMLISFQILEIHLIILISSCFFDCLVVFLFDYLFLGYFWNVGTCLDRLGLFGCFFSFFVLNVVVGLFCFSVFGIFETGLWNVWDFLGMLEDLLKGQQPLGVALLAVAQGSLMTSILAKFHWYPQKNHQ